MIKHIFLDMDGTLLNTKGKINPKTAEYLRQINIPVTLVSARAPMEMAFAINELNLHGPQISFNGGLIHEDNDGQQKIISSTPIDSKQVSLIINFIEKNYPDLSLSFYTRDQWIAKREDDGIKYEEKLTGLKPDLVSKYDFTPAIYKIMLINLDMKKAKKVRDDLVNNFNEVTAKSTGPQYVEVTNQKAQKKFSIQYIKKLEHLNKDEMMAFGDGENDLPMLNEVGHAIAMSNAQDDVKKQAEMVTLSNDEDGIVYALKKYLS